MIQTRYSGGSSNSAGANSLGGTMSSVSVSGESASYASTSIPGIAIAGSFNNPVDPGTSADSAALTYTGALKRVSFKPYGALQAITDLIDNCIDLTTSGDYNLHYRQDGYDASVTITVTYGSLTGSDVASAKLAVTHTSDQLFDNVPASEAKIGRTEYRCVYIYNGDTTSRTLSVFILGQPRASDSIAIGLDGNGVGATAVTIGADTSVPSGVTFATPSSASDGLAVTLPATSKIGLWIRRIVPPMSVSGADPDDFTIAYEVTA